MENIGVPSVTGSMMKKRKGRMLMQGSWVMRTWFSKNFYHSLKGRENTEFLEHIDRMKQAHQEELEAESNDLSIPINSGYLIQAIRWLQAQKG